MTGTSNRKITLFLIVSLLLNVALLSYGGWRLYKKNKNIWFPSHNKNYKPNYSMDRDELFEVLPLDSNAIVFLGNSITEYFEMEELLKNPKIKNRGIAGDRISGVIYRLKPIIAMQPAKIFIEIGTNDLGGGALPEHVIRNYKILIDTLRKSCPQTKLYVQSIFPVAGSSSGREKVNGYIREINKELLSYSIPAGYTYIDTYSKFELNGEMNETLSIDGVHLSGKGYLMWADILLPYVNE